MTDIYRYRSVDNLFGKYKELENQIIYFASLDQLNDPMEGLHDFVWSGDRIVWENFFRHYLYCLHKCCIDFLNDEDAQVMTSEDIPVHHTKNTHMLKSEHIGMVKEFYQKYFDSEGSEGSQLLDFLENGQRVRRVELLAILNFIHKPILHGLQSLYRDPGYADTDGQYDQILKDISGDVQSFFKILKSTDSSGSVSVEDIYSTLDRMQYANILAGNYLSTNDSLSVKEQNVNSLNRNFPSMYLEEMNKLIYTSWYTACFSKNYHNSSMWGNYTAGHRGACLIFEAVPDKSGCDSIILYSNSNNEWQSRRLYDVTYEQSSREVDFFRSISRLPLKELLTTWYSDALGNKSHCANHIGNYDSEINWFKTFFNAFYRNTTSKTKDWDHEEEKRLIIFDHYRKYTQPDRRQLKYDIKSLKGIMFGVNMENEDKFAIIQIIRKKIEIADHPGFKFYQAYYSPDEDNIQKFPLDLDDWL